jgi:Probable zinc-ribbon domain
VHYAYSRVPPAARECSSLLESYSPAQPLGSPTCSNSEAQPFVQLDALRRAASARKLTQSLAVMPPKQSAPDEYAAFVTHPRYGQRPRLTGLNPEPDYMSGTVYLHWHSPPESRIANTAIPADLSRQLPATCPVTHYFDVKRSCRDCGRQFLFFAEEQKYWYEELGFSLDSDCVRCVPCRKAQQGLAQAQVRYEQLFHIANRTVEESLEFVRIWLTLVEGSVFPARQRSRMLSVLNRLSSDLSTTENAELQQLSARLLALEEK